MLDVLKAFFAFIGVMILIVGLVAVLFLGIMFLWNAIIPSLFSGISGITYLETIGLYILCSILFKWKFITFSWGKK